MKTPEKESWWAEEESYQGQKKIKLSRANHLEELTQKINQLTIGKKIYLKIKSDYSDDRHRLDFEARHDYCSFYDVPIAFNFGKFNNGRNELTLDCMLMGTVREYGIVFSKDKIILRKYIHKFSVDFYENEVVFNIGGYGRSIECIEFILKDSAKLIFEINQIIHPNFIPNMTSIKQELGPGWKNIILIN